MRLRFFLILFWSLIFLSLPLQAGLVDPHQKWYTLQTSHFSIHYFKGAEALARLSGKYLEEAYEKRGRDFGVYPWGRTQVVLMDQDDAANGLATVIPYNLIILRLVVPTPDQALSDYDNWLKELIEHEYTHIVHMVDAGYPAKVLKLIFGKLVAPNALSPGWVTEGIATFYETEETGGGRGRASFSEMMLRTDILKNRFMTLDKMAGSSYEWPRWMVEYIYGVKFWQYLTETYGKDKVAEFSHRVGRSLWFYSFNHKAKKTFGKSFHDLWKEWKESLEKKYELELALLKEAGLKEGETLFPSRDTQIAPVMGPQGEVYFVETSDHHGSSIQVLRKGAKRSERVLKGFAPTQLSLSPAGDKLAFSSTSRYRRYSLYQEIYLYDLKTKKLKTLTHGQRARDPDFSKDGKHLLYVAQKMDRSELMVYDIDKENSVSLTTSPLWTQYDHPRWSPDGSKLAVSLFTEGGYRDIAIYSSKGKLLQRVSRTRSLENSPVWSPDGRFLYFSSDRTGISNIERYHVQERRSEQVTQVTSGAFSPTLSADAEDLIFQYYTGKGYELRKISLASFRPATRVTSLVQKRSSAAPEMNVPLPEASPKSYFPFKYLFPRYVLPNVAFLDNALFLSATVGSNDPLAWHNWFGSLSYRSDADYFGYSLGYTYSRWTPSLFTGYNDYLVNFGDLFATDNDFFEHRRRAYGGVGLPLSSNNPERHRLTGYYFFEDRRNRSTIPSDVALPPSLGHFAGFHFTYAYQNLNKFYSSISPESGVKFNVNYEVTNSLLAASEDLEQQIFWTDSREFLPLGAHHVLAFRQALGYTWGDRLLQGNFGLGGSLGESPLAATSTRLFTLRGLPLVTFSRERAMVLSMEYRLPLFRVQRGPGLAPVFFNSAHMAFFADYGDAWNIGQKSRVVDIFDNFMLGVGAELRADFVLAYYLPVTGRLGYGILVVNRDRATGFRDPLTGMDVSNGVLILELGTSF